jgi:hypothetical protein
MNKYYEVHRERTCKAIGSKDHHYIWDGEKKQFSTIADVKEFLKDEYGTCKRTKMYRDNKDGSSKHVGYIYHYNTPKVSYDDQAKNNQDWVEVLEIKATTIII